MNFRCVCRFTNHFSGSIDSMIFVYLVFFIAAFGSLSLQMIMVCVRKKQFKVCSIWTLNSKLPMTFWLITNSFRPQSIRAVDIAGILQSITIIQMTVITLYLFCYFGDLVTQRFDDVGEGVYQLPWYLLPLELQKHLPMVIAVAQKRVVFRSTREVFRKVSIHKFLFLL